MTPRAGRFLHSCLSDFMLKVVKELVATDAAGVRGVSLQRVV